MATMQQGMETDVAAGAVESGERMHEERTEGRKRVLVVDDHALVRAGLKKLIDATDDLEAAGEAGTAAEARQPRVRNAFRRRAARHLAARRQRARDRGHAATPGAGSPHSHRQHASGGPVRRAPAARRRERILPEGRRGEGSARRGARGRRRPPLHQPVARGSARARGHGRRPASRRTASCRAASSRSSSAWQRARRSPTSRTSCALASRR